MKRMLTWLALFTTFSGMPVAAEPIDVYFGGSGLYHAKFDPVNGKLGQAKPAADVKGAGFLAWHPGGDKLYAVTRLENGSGVAGFRTVNG